MEILTMKTKIFLISALTVGLGLGVASCDSYLDINQDPNSPTDENVTTSMVMPGAEMAIAQHYGDFLRITGGYFAQYYAQQFGTSNYQDYARFNMSASRSSRTYTELYQKALNNLKNVSDRATAQGDMGTVLAATTLRAFVFQVLVDCYGSVPYTEALNPEILAPHYDEGLTVYQGILAELDAALAQTDAAASVCTNFLFPNESADSWIKFAKALKLKILMRMSDVQDVQSQLSALVSEGDFPTADVVWANCWSDEAEKRSPLYSEEFAPGMQQNLVANLAIVNSMQVRNSMGNIEYTDPRLAVYFNPNASGNHIVPCDLDSQRYRSGSAVRINACVAAIVGGIVLSCNGRVVQRQGIGVRVKGYIVIACVGSRQIAIPVRCPVAAACDACISDPEGIIGHSRRDPIG